MPTNPIPAVPVATARYYPRLSEIITVDDLPEFLSFVENGLNSIFDKIHYKNLQYSKGYRGDSAFYSLDIVTSKRLALSLPFDLALVLNPDLKDGDAAISSFPITLEYQWEILAFLKTFSSSSFSFSIEDFYRVGLDVFRISEEQVIAHILNIFVEAEDGITKYEQLLADINDLQQITQDPSYQELAFPVGVEQSIDSVITLINNNAGITNSIPLLLFAVYILRSDLSETKQRLQQFYNIIAPDGIEAHIKRIITPKAKATLALSAGIEFPQNILRPVDEYGSDYKDPTTNQVDPDAKSMFVFAQAQLYADTEAGIGYQLEMGGSLMPSTFAMIGNTGLILQLDTLKIDLSKKNNIPEADADGRPDDFVGVYVRALSVTLPSRWFHDEALQGSPSTTLRLGGYDLLIGTGGISGTFMLETVPVLAVGGPVYYFEDKFDIIFPVTLLQKNEETLEIEDVEVLNIADLKSKLFPATSTADIPPYSFKFPISLTEKAPLTGGTKTFKSATEYQLYLNSFPNDNGVDAVPTLWKTIGSADKGFRVGFNKFDLTFKQNKVINSNIKGVLELNKKFKYPNDHPDSTLIGKPLHIDVNGHLYEDGDFNLTASVLGGIKANIFNFVDLNFLSVELGKQDDDFYIGTACEILFTNEMMQRLLKDQKIIIEKLRIYSDGNIELVGGDIPLPISISLNLGPVKMAVSNIRFGSTQIYKDGKPRKYNFWGFDGAISINPLGLDARGEGVKYYYTVDDNEDEEDVPENEIRKRDSFLSIQTIEVDLMIPGTATPESALAIIHGMISLPEPGKSPEFIGEVSLKLPKAKISGSVGMRFAPKYPAFLLDASIDLPTPIPLGPIAITAFRGLLGFRYIATKKAAGLTEDKSWYDYYKQPKRGVNPGKFAGPPDSLAYDTPFSIGAGATFGTTADGGHVLSMRAMLLLSLPSLFYIEAGLNIVSKRLGLIENDPSNPPFFAMVAFGDNSLELAAGADFSIPKDSGQIFQLHALLEAGFFFKNQKPWYVNLGTKQNPISAKVLTLFTAKSFIMLSAQGIEAGARLDYKLDKKFGPAKVRLWAYLELGGKISFKRPQMGAYMLAGGGINIKVLFINIEITLDTIFSVEAVKPFLIYAKLELRARVKLGFIKKNVSFTVELQWEFNRNIDYTPYSPLPNGTKGDKGDDRTAESVKGVHMLTNQAYPLHYFDAIPEADDITDFIPLDTYIDIKLAKGVLPKSGVSRKIGGYTSGVKNYTEFMPPINTAGGRKLRQVKHQYSIDTIELKAWKAATETSDGEWVDYHPFEAVVDELARIQPLVGAPDKTVKDLPWSYWQKAINQYDTIRVLGTNPFSFLSAGEPGWHIPEQYGITESNLFCRSIKMEPEYIDFLNKDIGQLFYVPLQYEADKINGLFFKLIGEGGVIIDDKIVGGDFMGITAEINPFGKTRSLSFKNYNQLEIIFPESAIEPTLKLTTHAATVKIKAYSAVTEGNVKEVSYKEVLLRKTENDPYTAELIYTKAELAAEIKLWHTETNPLFDSKIDKIVIIPNGANAERILEIRSEIAALFSKTYDEVLDDEVSISVPSNLTLYNDLLEELAQLKMDAGNDNSNPSGLPTNVTFTHFYGYKEKSSYTFDHILKFNDTYLIVFHPQANMTALVQIDANGKILRERLLNGVITSMQVINDNLVLTQALDASLCKGIGTAIINDDFVVGCQGSVATTAIVELDSELNQNFGIQYANAYSLGFNKLISIDNNEMLWINTLANETQINWVNGNDHAIVYCVKIDEVAIKLLQHSSTEFSLITKDKKIIRFSINTIAKTISLINAAVIADTTIAEIIDAVIANNKIVISIKMANGQFGLAKIDGTTVSIVNNETIFDTAIYLSNNTLVDNTIVAYNKNYLFLFDEYLSLTRLIERGDMLEEASIVAIQNEPSANEILMLSAKSNEKGVYFSLFDDQFDNCSLNLITTPSVISSTATLTALTTSFTEFSTADSLTYKKGIKYSNLITINDVICSKGGNDEEDEELEYTTFVQQIGWLSRESYLYNETIPEIPAVREDNVAMKAGTQETVQPIWRPNTTYYLHFTLKDKVEGKGSTPFEYYYGFKTLGPVGHYPITEPVTTVGEEVDQNNEVLDLGKSPLASLRQYIDYNRSYPNADGSLLQAKPVFYGNGECKIELFFANPYVYHMLTPWNEYKSGPKIEGKLNIMVKDPQTDIVIPYPLPIDVSSYTYPTPVNETWEDDNDPRIPLGVKLVNNFIQAVNDDDTLMQCELVIGEPLKPKSYGYNVSLTDLKPSKMYTILVNNYFDGTTKQNKNVLVHQFGFQTSRYKNFSEQVNSYYTEDLDEPETINKALFDVNLDLTQDQIDALYHLVSADAGANTLSDSLALQYQHVFDRAIDGVLKLSPLDPAQNTEINRIIDTNTGDIVALLIRNPEPFNIPKMPLEEIKNTITVVDIAIDEDENKVYTPKVAYKILHSKDYSQVMIMHLAKKITDVDLNIRFEYRTWNNNGTVVSDMVPLTLFDKEAVLVSI